MWKAGLRAIPVLACLAGFVSAQDFRATLTGQITDPSKAPVPNARVKAVKEGTNETKETQTNNEGVYNLPFLDPGNYTVEVSAAGFNLARRAVVLRVADRLNLSLALEIGPVTQEVTVIGQQELLETQTASRGLNFDPLKVQEYPLNGRQTYMLMALTPGVLFTQQQFGSSGFSGTRAWDVNGSYSMNGGRTGTNQFLLNGAPISTDGTWQIAPNVEAVQEFKVMVNTYDAEYGRSGGGHVNTTIKSGTNEVHGSLFDFWRNTVLDANARQNNMQGAPRGKRNQHQFGGAIGLPIRKDKDFLFYAFEGWRERVPFPVVTNTIPAGMRDGGGFTQFGIKIYDPLTSRLCRSGVDVPGNCLSGGQYIRDPFPGNEIPKSRISPIGKKIVDLFPLPNQATAPTLLQNYFATGAVGKYRYEQNMFRYDKLLGDKDRLYGLFYFEDGSEYRNSSGFPPPAQTGNMPGTIRTKHGTVVDWTRTISPTRVMDIRAAWTRYWENFPDVSDRDFTYQSLGMKKLPRPPNAVSNTPRIELDNYQTILGGRLLNWSSRDQLDLQASLNETHGRHTLKYGLEISRIQRGTRNEGRAAGNFQINRFWTQQYSGRGQGSTDGYPVATLLLGLPTGGSIDYNDTYLRSEPYVAGFVQDDWKVTNRLTLNLGLRYDVQFPLMELHDRLLAGFAFDQKNPLSDQVVANWRKMKAEWDAANPTLMPYPDPPSALYGGPLYAGKGGQPRRTYDWDRTNFQPRVGFAYRIQDKTVLRGGFGIFHRTATQGNLTTGFDQSTPYQRSKDGDRTPSAPNATGPYSFEDPFPDGLIPPTGSSLGLLTNVGRGLSIDGRQRVIPRTYEYSFTIERELPMSSVLEIGYVGSRTIHEPMGINLSDMSMQHFAAAEANPNEYNRPLPNPFYGVLPGTSDFGNAPVLNRRNFYRRFPLFNGVTYNTNPWGAAFYDAFQLKFEKRSFERRASGALTWVVSYTFAKNLERALLANQTFERPNPFIHQLTSIDRPSQFSFHGIWDVPFGKERHFKLTSPIANAIAGGWNVDWILTFYEGVPTGKPDAVFSCGSYSVKDQNPDRWFNNYTKSRPGPNGEVCYADRPSYTFRAVENRFPDIRNPAYGPQVNLAIAKKFAVTERWELEMRGESFNLTNTPILDGPNTDQNNARFGMLPIQQLNFPRQVQIGARLKF